MTPPWWILTQQSVAKNSGDLLFSEAVTPRHASGYDGLHDEDPFNAVHVGNAAADNRKRSHRTRHESCVLRRWRHGRVGCCKGRRMTLVLSAATRTGAASTPHSQQRHWRKRSPDVALGYREEFDVVILTTRRAVPPTGTN